MQNRLLNLHRPSCWTTLCRRVTLLRLCMSFGLRQGDLHQRSEVGKDFTIALQKVTIMADFIFKPLLLWVARCLISIYVEQIATQCVSLFAQHVIRSPDCELMLVDGAVCDFCVYLWICCSNELFGRMSLFPLSSPRWYDRLAWDIRRRRGLSRSDVFAYYIYIYKCSTVLVAGVVVMIACAVATHWFVQINACSKKKVEQEVMLSEPERAASTCLLCWIKGLVQIDAYVKFMSENNMNIETL